MDREILIENTLKNIKMLPDSKIREVNDFSEFLISKLHDRLTTEGMQYLVSESKSFDFLNEEEEIYSVKDLKEKYK